MNNTLAIGLMSGTSADGVSAALAGFRGKSIGLLDYDTFPYHEKIFQKIINAKNLATPEISALNFELGDIFADAALRILKKNKLSPEKVSVIGCHGQTIFHNPRKNTFQIGEPAVIAEKTGITVVSDFRQADLAAGGEGAPLIPFFDQYFFGGGAVRAMQNIGGIANVAIVGKGISRPLAFDTGPGNCLIDWAASEISRGKLSYDPDGRLAGKGWVNLSLVNEMMRHAYFKTRPPKSTGRELFNESFLPENLKKLISESPNDALNTITFFTASAIRQSYKMFVSPKFNVKEVILSGGGVFNKTLVSHLEKLLYPARVSSIVRYGIHPMAKEPLAFAFYALRAMQGKFNNCPSATGAKEPRILGKITPGRNFKGFL